MGAKLVNLTTSIFTVLIVLSAIILYTELNIVWQIISGSCVMISCAYLWIQDEIRRREDD